MNLRRLALCFLLICEASRSQHYDQGGDDYQDYADGYAQEDNLYADYANRKAEKAAGGGGGGGWGKTLAFAGGAWFLGGKIHSKRALKKVSTKHKKEIKELYLHVLALQEHNQQLEQYINDISKGQLDAEFDAADTDRDNRVSRAEFNMYKKQYLAQHPEMASQFPNFEDFDPDRNGLISKAEYDAYYRKLGL